MISDGPPDAFADELDIVQIRIILNRRGSHGRRRGRIGIFSRHGTCRNAASEKERGSAQDCATQVVRGQTGFSTRLVADIHRRTSCERAGGEHEKKGADRTTSPGSCGDGMAQSTSAFVD
jgi:hypothetical protein